jgi:hypothetical protein
LEVANPNETSSVILITTSDVEPGLLTEAILIPKVFVIVLPDNDALSVELPPLPDTLEKLKDNRVELLVVSIRSIAMLNGTGQLLVMVKSMVPPENVALVNPTIEPPLNDPTFVSFTDGNGATTDETLKLLVDRVMSNASVKSIVVGVVVPGLDTEAIRIPIVLGSVSPVSDLVSVLLPPLGPTLESEKEVIVELVSVSTKSISIDNEAGQLLVKPILIVPPSNVALVNEPNDPPEYVPKFVSFTAGKAATRLETFKFEVLMTKSIASCILIVTGPVEPGDCTDLILKPVVFGNVLPAKDAD